MFLFLALVSATVTAIVTVGIGLRRAPEAYEDESGFHLLRQNAARPRMANAGTGFPQTRPRTWLLWWGLSKKTVHRTVFSSGDGSRAAEAPLGRPLPRRI